jgi:predicted lipoprotein
VLVACTTLLAGPGCRVVRDEDRDKGSRGGGPASEQGFDAATWVASVWEAKVLPAYQKDAVAIGPVLDALSAGLDPAGQRLGRRADVEGSPWTFTVKGTGRVVSVDTASRSGSMVVAVDSASGPQEVTLQIGPVVRGTAIRDSLAFFKFGDVTNQIEFAQVARALNDRAIAGVQPSLEAVKAPGTRIEFAGAMNVSAEGDPRIITPLSLKRAGSR